jgi:hypothetical protein
MSENGATTEIVAMPAPPPAPPEPAPLPARRRPVWPWFFLPGFLLLAGGEAYLWQRQLLPPAQATQLAVLQAQVADLRTLAARPPAATNEAAAQADLSVKFASLGAQVNALQAQVAADHGTLSTLQENSTDLTKLTARIALLNALETARMALDAGQPLGTIPGAPPALAQFAANAPPTEAQLRLSFPAAAQAAEAASIAGAPKGGYWSKVLARLENFITIRAGTQVLIGAPAAGAVEQANMLLQAGDLAGAVAQLDTLSPDTQQAMGNWLAQARALLAARTALITLAAQA